MLASTESDPQWPAGGAARSVGIDYSRWDRLVCSSSENDNDEEACEDSVVCDEMEEPEEEGNGGESEEGSYGEGGVAEDVDVIESGQLPWEEDDEEDEKGEDEEETMASGTARTEEECDGLTHCDERNRRILLKCFEKAGGDIRAAYLAVARSLEDQVPCVEKVASLASWERKCVEQLATYTQMLVGMDEKQIHQTGARQLRHLVHRWQKYLLLQLESLRIPSISFIMHFDGICWLDSHGLASRLHMLDGLFTLACR